MENLYKYYINKNKIWRCKMSGINKITTSLRIMETLLKKAKAKAKKSGLSFSAYVVVLIENDLKTKN